MDKTELEYLQKGDLFVTGDYYLSCFLKSNGAKYLGVRLIKSSNKRAVNGYVSRFVFYPEILGEDKPETASKGFEELIMKWLQTDSYAIKAALEASSLLKYQLKNIRTEMSDAQKRKEDIDVSLKKYILPIDEKIKAVYDAKDNPNINLD